MKNIKQINGVPCVLGKVHRLATEGNIKGAICQGVDRQLYSTHSHPENEMYRNHNLYITNDEEIKEDDWYFDRLNKVCQLEDIRGNIFLGPNSVAVKKGKNSYDKFSDLKDCRKIIASTDSKLITNGVANIPQQFIQDYCNKPVDEVWIEVESINSHVLGLKRLKLNSNNEITIHNVREKMYSREEIESFGRFLMKLTNRVIRKETKMTPLDEISGNSLVKDMFEKWIEENL